MPKLSGRPASPPKVCRSGGCGTIGIRGGAEGICCCNISWSRLLERSFLLSFRWGVLLADTDRSRDLLRRRKLKEPLRRREPSSAPEMSFGSGEIGWLTVRYCCCALVDRCIVAGG